MPHSDIDPRRTPRLASPAGDVEVLPAHDAVAFPAALRRPVVLSPEATGAVVLALDVAFTLLLLGASGLLGGLAQAVVAVAAVVVMSVLSGRARAARLAVGEALLEELPRLNHVAVVTTLLVAGTASLAGDATPGAPQLAATWAFVLVAGALAQLVGSRLRRAVVASERCLLVGPADRRARFERCVATVPGHRLAVVGAADLHDVGRGDGTLPTIEELIARHRATRVIVLEGTDPARAAQAARRARNAGARVSIAQESLESVGPPEHVEQVGSALLLSHSPTASAAGAGAMKGKRALDVAGALGGLLALAPLLAAIALAIRLTSHGPVLFWQDRIGLGGRRFKIAKFRTMVIDAEARKDDLRDRNEAGGGLFKIADDPRVTRVGRFLRRTSLDELPQLLNVLRGEMSLVGPRPLVTDEDALIGGWYRDRLQLKPGMTGRWQIMGSARIPLADMIRLDQQYVASWSLWLDLRILLRTAVFVVRRRGL